RSLDHPPVRAIPFPPIVPVSLALRPYLQSLLRRCDTDANRVRRRARTDEEPAGGRQRARGGLLDDAHRPGGDALHQTADDGHTRRALTALRGDPRQRAGGDRRRQPLYSASGGGAPAPGAPCGRGRGHPRGPGGAGRGGRAHRRPLGLGEKKPPLPEQGPRRSRRGWRLPPSRSGRRASAPGERSIATEMPPTRAAISAASSPGSTAASLIGARAWRRATPIRVSVSARASSANIDTAYVAAYGGTSCWAGNFRS